MLFGRVPYLVCVLDVASFLGARSRHLGPEVADGFEFVMLLAPSFVGGGVPGSLRLQKVAESIAEE